MTLVQALLATHAAAFLIGIAWALTRKRAIGNLSMAMLVAAFGVNVALFVTSWSAAGRAPIKTLYETMLLWPMCVTLVTMILFAMYRLRVLAPITSALCIGGLVYAMAKPDAEIINLPPALQSFWFIPHVVTYFVAYSALFVSFSLAVLALWKPDWRSDREDAGFEVFAHRATMFGFTTLTFGLCMGAIWGKEAWGDYWSWDPKENWALVTFLAYLVYFHLRMVRGWQGRRAMALLAISFVAVVFTYLGMSLLPTAQDSMHVYQ